MEDYWFLLSSILEINNSSQSLPNYYATYFYVMSLKNKFIINEVSGTILVSKKVYEDSKIDEIEVEAEVNGIEFEANDIEI